MQESGERKMTEKRFTIKEIDNFNYGIRVTDVICDKGIELPSSTACDLLNELHEENQALKDALWTAETEYIHERYFDNPIRKEESINELKEDFKRGYWND